MHVEGVYRTFQVEVAPGSYGGITLFGAFSYFLFDYKWLPTFVIFLTIFAMVLIDKPFKFILFSKKKRLFLFISCIFLSLFMPPLIFINFGEIGRLIALILVPVGGLVTAIFVYFTYREEILQSSGWRNLGGGNEKNRKH